MKELSSSKETKEIEKEKQICCSSKNRSLANRERSKKNEIEKKNLRQNNFINGEQKILF